MHRSPVGILFGLDNPSQVHSGSHEDLLRDPWSSTKIPVQGEPLLVKNVIAITRKKVGLYTPFYLPLIFGHLQGAHVAPFVTRRGTHLVLRSQHPETGTQGSCSLPKRFLLWTEARFARRSMWPVHTVACLRHIDLCCKFESHSGPGQWFRNTANTAKSINLLP